MKIWAVANQKGGVGKTTTAINLAGVLVTRGARVLLVDFDPHGSLTAYLGFNPEHVKASAYHLFQHSAAAVEPLILDTRLSGLHLLPAAPALATLDRQLGAQTGKGLVLKQALDRVRSEYDYVIIDCPPVLGVLMINALAASEQLVVPVQTEYLALKGLDRMMSTLTMVAQSLKRSMPYVIVPTMFDKRTRSSNDCLKTLRENYPYAVAAETIPIDTLFREASRVQLPLTVWQAESRGAVAYNRLLDIIEPPSAAQTNDEEAIVAA